MTADTYQRLRYVWWPVLIRLGVIAAAAAITTQPFEVMVFNGPIQRRIHDESVRVQAYSRLRDLEDAQAKSKGAVGQKGTADYKNLEDTEERKTEVHDQLTQFRTDAQTARAEMQSAEGAIRSALSAAARANTRAQAASANRRLMAARSRLEQAQRDANTADAKVKVAEAEEISLTEQADKARGVISGKEGLAEQDVQRLRDWITQIRNAQAGEFVTERREQLPRWEFQDQDYDFFQRLGVINDLYYGRPARWLEVPPEDRRKLYDLFSLSEDDESDSLTKERRAADAHTFFWSYWAVIGIAAVFPLLLLAFKGLLPVDLKLYYSTRAQQAAGNFEAIRFSMAGDLSATHHKGDGNNNNNNGRH
jgi:hypothetical protein